MITTTFHPRPFRFLTVCSLLALGLALPLTTGAQCERPVNVCSAELTEFLTDTKPYKAVVKEGASVHFKMQLYEGFLYRVVACTDVPGAQIRYTVYDGSKKPVFSHVGSASGAYWDFEIGSSDEFTIKASLSKGAGCVVFGVGYDESVGLGDDLEEEDDPFYDDELSDKDYGLDD